jgi:TolB-like protein
MASAPDVFLSYNREDQAVARRFAEGFERAGLNVWWDQTLRSGEAYDQVTEQALRGARAVVVLWSKRSVDSRWVRAEATLADRQHTLVPAMIEPCERPIMFELTQTADLCRWGGEPSDPAWNSFLADVHRFVVERRSSHAGGATATLPASAPPVGPANGVAPATGVRDYRPSLAILPFTNRSRDPDDDVFADGMVEDLIAALSLSQQLKVIARSATLAYRGNASDLRSIGVTLGVRYLMEGNVRRIGDTLRVTTQLIEANDGAILWTQKFDRPLTQLAELQEALVTEVAHRLGVQIQSAEMRRALQKPDHLTAWEAVMRAQVLALNALNSRTLSVDPGAAIAEARRAVNIDPNYALAHVTLATTLGVFNSLLRSDGPDPALSREVLECAERAVALDARDPTVLAMAAIAQMGCGGAAVGAACARRALEINPNAALSRQAMLFACVRSGRADEAVAHAEAYLELAPGDFRTHLVLCFLGLAYFIAGRYERALDAVDRALVLAPMFSIAVRDRAIYLGKLRQRDEARAAVRRLRAVEPNSTLETHLSRINASGAVSQEVARSMSDGLRELWLDTPQEPSAA